MSCAGLTRAGLPCRNRPRAGSDRCYVHARPVADLEAEALEHVRAASASDWRAAAWLLEWVRRGDRPPPVEQPADGLDELASKRAARRA